MASKADKEFLGYCVTCNCDSTTEVCTCGNIVIRYRTVQEVYPEINELAKRKPLPLIPRNSQSRHSILDGKSLSGGS